MRFSTILSSALLVGLVAAAPTNKEADSYSSSADASSAASSAMATESSKSSSSSSSGSYGSNYGSSGSNYGSSGSNYDSSSSSSSSSSGSYGSNYGSSSGSDCSKDGSCDASSSSSSYDSSYTSSSSDCSKDGSCNPTTSSAMAESTMMMDSSTMMMDSTSTMMMDSTSTMMMDTSTADATSTSTAYGSGYTNWGGSGYNDCVQQCIASYGAPPASWTPSSTMDSSDGSYSGSSGTGATHTVIVAPTQGVLRYVPFAVNASVGDTVMFVWNAKNHTVTKSSALEICNKTSDAPFASGEHDAPFTFTQVVNDTNPTFFYCGTPGHCQKGMFGMINPPSSYNAGTSVSQMMGSAVSNSSDMAAMMAYTNSLTANNTKAAEWGSNIDVASLPEWAHASVLENVMYTRAFLGANPETLKDDGSIDMSGDTPKMIPTDMAPINNAVDSGSATSSTNAQAAPSAASSASAAPSAAASGKSNGAAGKAASSALLGVAALAAAVLAF